MSAPYISFTPTSGRLHAVVFGREEEVASTAAPPSLTIGPALALGPQSVEDLEGGPTGGLLIGTGATTTEVDIGSPSNPFINIGGNVNLGGNPPISWAPYPGLGFSQFYGTANAVIPPVSGTPDTSNAVTFAGAIMTYPANGNPDICPNGGWPGFPISNGTYSWNLFDIAPGGDSAESHLYEVSWHVPVTTAGVAQLLALYIIHPSGPYTALEPSAGVSTSGILSNRLLVSIQNQSQVMLINTGVDSITVGGGGAPFNLLIRQMD